MFYYSTGWRSVQNDACIGCRHDGSETTASHRSRCALPPSSTNRRRPRGRERPRGAHEAPLTRGWSGRCVRRGAGAAAPFVPSARRFSVGRGGGRLPESIRTHRRGRGSALRSHSPTLMVFEYIIRYSSRRRASPWIAEGFSPTARGAYRIKCSISMSVGRGGGRLPDHSCLGPRQMQSHMLHNSSTMEDVSITYQFAHKTGAPSAITIAPNSLHRGAGAVRLCAATFR